MGFDTRGMEIPCVLILKSKGQTVDKAKKLIVLPSKDTVINEIDPDITVDQNPPKKIKMEEDHEIQCP